VRPVSTVACQQAISKLSVIGTSARLGTRPLQDKDISSFYPEPTPKPVSRQMGGTVACITSTGPITD
jgi:hypothetical protein